jgi:hypothetical protein
VQLDEQNGRSDIERHRILENKPQSREPSGLLISSASILR